MFLTASIIEPAATRASLLSCGSFSESDTLFTLTFLAESPLSSPLYSTFTASPAAIPSLSPVTSTSLFIPNLTVVPISLCSVMYFSEASMITPYIIPLLLIGGTSTLTAPELAEPCSLAALLVALSVFFPQAVTTLVESKIRLNIIIDLNILFFTKFTSNIQAIHA